nr:VWA domain-containing protein [Gellertiella hungarica]
MPPREEKEPHQGLVLPALSEGDGSFADNIVYFARALRKAGLRVGPASVTEAIEAVLALGIGSREEFHAALSAVFVKRREDQQVFDEAFQLFWRARDYISQMMSMMLPTGARKEPEKQRAGAARIGDAFNNRRQNPAAEDAPPEVVTDARFTASGNEVLRKMDFAQMTATELAAARKAIEALRMPDDRVKLRRFRPALRGKLDARATLRASLRSGGDILLPRFRKRREAQPPLVVLADISGSMSQYSRVFLHFLHVLASRRKRVHVFLFGTRLTNVSRQIANRDPDLAVEACTAMVTDWSGGTRIGETLKEFNRLWGRRVLGQGAIVLLLTDGLEREGVDVLEHEIDRLHRSCRRLIWLNPLLRFEGFEARARGVKAMMPHVDEFRAVHNLDSLDALVEALAGHGNRTDRRFAFGDAGAA